MCVCLQPCKLHIYRCNYTHNVEAVVGKGTHFHPDDFCVTDIKETDWQETRRIPIYARLDGKLDGNQTRVVNLIMQKWNRSNWNVQRILKSVEVIVGLYMCITSRYLHVDSYC